MKVNKKPIVTTYKLESDPEGEATVTVRQARAGDTMARAGLFSETTRVWNDETVGEIQLKQKWNIFEQKRYEAWLTVVEITGIVDEDNKPFFKSKDSPDGPRLTMSRQEFFDAWDSLSDEVADDIHGKVLEMNPKWDPDAEASKN